MATLSRETADIAGIHAYVVRPKQARAPLTPVIAYSDVFQLTEPHLRSIDRIASHGFFVVAPEIYSKIEPPNTPLDFERDRDRALGNAAKMKPEWIDEERRKVIDWVLARKNVDANRLAVCGWCFGGHLAFRAAQEQEVRATVCFYATGLHEGQYGTLDASDRIGGSLLLIWGSQDPHIPEEGRGKIHATLARSNVRFEVRLFDAEHAFMRDVGPRWDPEATDAAFFHMIDRFRRAAG
jgi:carboxymethylenebutenolidase